MRNKIPEEARFHDRFKYFIELKKVKQRQIARDINVTEGAVNKWKDGSRFPKDDTRLSELAEVLGINIVDLFPNSIRNREDITKQELKLNIEKYLDDIPSSPLPSSLKPIPIHRGYPTSNEIIEEECMPFVKNIFIDKRMVLKQYQEEHLEAVVVVGDSMAPYLNHGDVAICYVTPTFKGAGKYVLNTPHGLELRSVAFLRDGSLHLSSENPTYPTELIAKEEVDTFEFFGLVIGRIMKS